MPRCASCTNEVTPVMTERTVLTEVRRERTAHDEVVFFSRTPDRFLGHSPLQIRRFKRYNHTSTTHHTGTTSTTGRPAADETVERSRPRVRSVVEERVPIASTTTKEPEPPDAHRHQGRPWRGARIDDKRHWWGASAWVTGIPTTEMTAGAGELRVPISAGPAGA
jgi:hypothetical protein